MAAKGRFLLHPYARCYPIENGLLLLTKVRMNPNTEKFWSFVAIAGETDCWEWQGGIHQNGYGGYRQDKKSWKAHRYSWTIIYGPIPDGLLVCHKCDNRKCVNPNHLFLGTQKDNIQDRIKKGRSNYAKGERHGHAKLSLKTVIEIKKMLQKGIGQTEIGNLFSIDHRQVHGIAHGKIWGWVTI